MIVIKAWHSRPFVPCRSVWAAEDCNLWADLLQSMLMAASTMSLLLYYLKIHIKTLVRAHILLTHNYTLGNLREKPIQNLVHKDSRQKIVHQGAGMRIA